MRYAFPASLLMLALFVHIEAAWPLGFVALVPWLWALQRIERSGAMLRQGLWMCLAFTAIGFAWFAGAIGAYTGIGTPAAMGLLLLAAPLFQPQWLAFAAVFALARRRHGAAITLFLASVAWVAAESIVPKLLGDTLGHGLQPSAPFRQLAEFGGATGLSLLLLCVNGALALALTRRKEGLRAWAMPLGTASAVLLLGVGLGQLRLQQVEARAGDAPSAALRVAMVQASLTDYEARRRTDGTHAVVREILDTHFELSVSALRDHGADVLLWPETVYPTPFGHPRSEAGAEFDREIQDFVDAVGVPLVFGSYDVDVLGEYNAAVFLEPGRGVLGRYRKTHPFPLTETVPEWLDSPSLRETLPWAGAWRAGDGARVLPLRSVDGREINVAPLICLDDVRPQLAIDAARLGAQALIGLSNDSWFTDYPTGARLHLAVASFRSVETRLPQLRVTTNGPSAFIDDTGEVLVQTAMGQQAALTGVLEARNPAPTLMVRWGDWVGRAGLGVLLLWAAFSAWRTWWTRRVEPGLPSEFRVMLLTRTWRWILAGLHVLAGAGLVALAVDMALVTGWQVQSLSQISDFGALVVAPVILAFALRRIFAGEARIEAHADGSILAIEQRRQRIEIPLAALRGLRPWRLPLPCPGMSLSLSNGRPWNWGVGLWRPRALQTALENAGASAPIEGSLLMRCADHAEYRGRARHRWLDHGAIKFGLFPLLPALVAFHLHQVIAFGGPFGEWLTYGATAWLGGLGLWWASWSLGLMLFAGVLRVGTEALNLAVIAAIPSRAAMVRQVCETVTRLAYFGGVPAWLLYRVILA